jgi:Nif-specific regulatory protein
MTGRDGSPDRYRLHRVLGEGGSGRVWLVEDSLRPGSRLALKELTGAGSGSVRHEEQLRKEFATLASLRHPNLVEVHEFDTGPESGMPRFTLEFIRGRDIVEAVAHEGAGIFLDLTAEALRALGFLHDFELLHRDLKPANLLVRDKPKLGCRVVIVDFGLADLAGDDPPDALKAKGTLPYMAPEAFRKEPASPRSDLYSLAAVLYHTVFGRPPIVPEGDDWTRFIQAVTEGRRSRPPMPPGYPEGLAGWFTEVLSPAPDDRPATAAEALVRLNESCGTGYPAETPASRAARLMSGPPAERESDVARIWSDLETASGPRLVWLCGAPGYGKSRVLRWLEADAVRRGWTVSAPGPESVPSLDSLRSSAAAGPTLLLLDEVDAAGAPLVDLVERVAREGSAPPLRVVAALSREGIQHPALRRLFADTGTVPTLRTVELGRLDADGTRAMAVRATGGSVSEERVRWLLDASEGSPAGVESLLIDGAWEKGGLPADASVPDPLHSGRFEMLPRAARSWLESLAVIRGDARDELLADLSGLDAATARAASEEVSAAGLAFRRAGRWFPASRALAEQLRARIDPERLRVLCEGAAERLTAEAEAPVDPWVLSRLWSDAGASDRAVECAVQAAEQAMGAGDPAKAAARYAGALRQLGHDREFRYDLRIKQGDAHVRSGVYRAAARAFGAAIRLAPTDEAAAAALTRQADALVQSGRFERALIVAERAARLASSIDDAGQLAQAKKVAGIVLGRLGRENQAIPLLEGAREILRKQGDKSSEAEIVQVLATCKLRLGREEAERDFLRAIELYREAREQLPGKREDGGSLKALIGLAVIKTRRRAYGEAVDLLTHVGHEAKTRGNLSLQQAAIARLAGVALDRGELDKAIGLGEQAADLALHLGDHNLILVNRSRVAEALIRCGRPGDAIVLLREAIDLPRDKTEPENVDTAHVLLAAAWLESGQADESNLRSLLEETLARCDRRRKSRGLLVALAIEMERRARASSPDPFEPISERFDAVLERSEEPVGPEIRCRAELARAGYYLSRGDPEAARQAAEAARDAAGKDAPELLAQAHAVLGPALERLGRETDASRVLDEGAGLLEQAAAAIEDRAVREDFLRRPVFRSLGEPGLPAGRRTGSRLLVLYDMIRTLNSETDPDALLESILDMALRAVRAERGMILLKDDRDGAGDDDFSVHIARNLESETVDDVQAYSRSIVAAAGAGRSMLAIDAGEDQRFRDLKSVSLFGIRSLMCVPLRSRGRVIGTVYLDNRQEGGLFTPDDLKFVEAFADHAALALENTRTRVRLERQNLRLQAAAETRTRFGNMVGRSPGMLEVFELVEKVAATHLPVLIFGESGTGKELVARAIHYHGPRRRKMFVSENCAAIPETLLESELFGHVRGAFTGAERDHPGLFEQADGGTLFLDEVGDMSRGMQARLLRALEEGEIRRVGGDRPVRVDVRVVAATHRNLWSEVRAGKFREDLLYRLQVLSIEIPPLRDRPGDVPLLVEHFLERIASDRGAKPPSVDEDAMMLLERHGWPGNVREMENALQRLVLLAGGGPITVTTIEADPALRRELIRETPSREPLFSLKSGEKEQIRRALKAAHGNRRRAAQLLGVSRATLYRKLRQHGL